MGTPSNLTPQQHRLTSGNPILLYKEMLVGNRSWLTFAWAEFLTILVSPLPGLPGLSLRSLLYPTILASSGRRPAFGRSIILRGLPQISLGEKVIVDDFACLDARGPAAKIALGDNVVIGRFSSVVAKDAAISLADGVNIGSYCRIASQSQVTIGQSVLVGAFSYIGPGNHQRSADGTPLIAGEMELKGGVNIGPNCWIGAHTTILDGVTIGEGSIIGANSLVKDSIPDHSIAVGSPARVVSS